MKLPAALLSLTCAVTLAVPSPAATPRHQGSAYVRALYAVTHDPPRDGAHPPATASSSFSATAPR